MRRGPVGFSFFLIHIVHRIQRITQREYQFSFSYVFTHVLYVVQVFQTLTTPDIRTFRLSDNNVYFAG